MADPFPGVEFHHFPGGLPVDRPRRTLLAGTVRLVPTLLEKRLGRDAKAKMPQRCIWCVVVPSLVLKAAAAAPTHPLMGLQVLVLTCPSFSSFPLTPPPKIHSCPGTSCQEAHRNLGSEALMEKRPLRIAVAGVAAYSAVHTHLPIAYCHPPPTPQKITRSKRQAEVKGLVGKGKSSSMARREKAAPLKKGRRGGEGGEGNRPGVLKDPICIGAVIAMGKPRRGIVSPAKDLSDNTKGLSPKHTHTPPIHHIHPSIICMYLSISNLQSSSISLFFYLLQYLSLSSS